MHILVCGGTGCSASRSHEITKNLQAALKDKGLEEQVQVILTGCFGFCEKGPIVKVMPDNTFYTEVKPEDALEIVEEHVIKGRKVKRLLYTDPETKEHVADSKHMNFYKKQLRIALRNCGFIDPENIEEYIANNDEITGDVKFWVTGYSRGAATANLVAQKLDAKAIYSKNSIYEKSNIYAYCFECPRNMIKDKDDSYYAQFNNIFNIVNYADIVTKVAMPDWGYTRYGIDMNLPSPENTSGYKTAYEKMLKEYKKIVAKVDSPSMTADEAAKLMKNQGSFTDKISAALSSYFDSQVVYVVAYQDDMRDLLAKTLGSEDIGIDTVLSTILNMGVFPILHPYIALKAASNLSEIGQAHYPELCLAWVDAIAAENSFASSKIRQIHINCPVDVSVYDSNGTLVAQIINDEPIDIDGSYISAFVDENGQKVVLEENVPVSMNMWGFTPDYFVHSEKYFVDFLKENIDKPKSEFFIPLVVNELITKGIATVKVLDTTAKWFGVTYAADRQGVVDKIQALVDAGEYPNKLF